MAQGKRYTDAVRHFDLQQEHTPAEAVDLVKSVAAAKFDETVELAVRLGVDPRKADQIVRGTVVPAEITIFEDRWFTFITKTPPTPVLLRAAAGIDKGAQTTGREIVATISDAQLTEIAQTKMPDLNANDLEAAKKQVAGTARSMGIKVG